MYFKHSAAHPSGPTDCDSIRIRRVEDARPHRAETAPLHRLARRQRQRAKRAA